MRPSKVGVVVSQGKMQKTVKVRVQNVNWNRHVDKNIVSYRTMLVHDELDKCREGDVVRVEYCRPLSARKSWAVAELMRLRGASWVKYNEEIPPKVRAEENAKRLELQTRGVGAQLHELGLDALDRQINDVEAELGVVERVNAEVARLYAEEPELVASLGGSNKSITRNLVRKHVRRALGLKQEKPKNDVEAEPAE